MKSLAALLLLPIAVLHAAEGDDAIWIEGEKPTKADMHRHPWWYDQVKKDVLSGGDWISNFDKDHEGTADYDFNATTADT